MNVTEQAHLGLELIYVSVCYHLITSLHVHNLAQLGIVSQYLYLVPLQSVVLMALTLELEIRMMNLLKPDKHNVRIAQCIYSV